MKLDGNKDDFKDVWIFAEQRENTLRKVSLELLGEGRKLAEKVESKVCAVLVGDNVSHMSSTLFEYGADKVYLIENELLKDYTTDGYTKVISDVVREKKPEIFLIGATDLGRDLAPRIASRITTGLTADCTGLDIDENTGGLLQTRPAFGGNLMATIITSEHRPQMATVRPGVMDRAECQPGRTGELLRVKADIVSEDIQVKVLDFIEEGRAPVMLEEADVIVSGGRAMGGPDGFEPLQVLAQTLKGEIGASRVAVDSGWIEKAHQVGQTGKTVKPVIYFACGISGSVQHMAGMKESDVIVAINTNPDAPIVDIANYSIIGDYREVVPAIADAIEKAKTNGCSEK